VPPEAGVDKPGFIDNSKGAPIYTAPTEAGGVLVRDVPLPPAARVFASGTHPRLKHWWYVTAYLDGTMLRGYIEDFRVNVELPEPLAELRQLHGGETPEGLAKEKFGGAVRDGHDLRYYENVLLYVNQGRAGIGGTYQDPSVLGGSNNIKLYKNHRIWLVSPEYAKAVEGVVPSGSLTGGAVAKVKRFGGHLQDILQSVTESRHHFGEVAGEFAQAIRDHMTAIVGITAGFLTLEAGSMFLAATPTGVGQAAAAVIQLALTSFGAAGMVEGGINALKHGSAWLTLAWTANGKPELIAEASKEFLRMLVAVAIAALSYTGAKANYRNALKIGNNVPTGSLPALAPAGGRTSAGVEAVTGVSIGPGVGAGGVVGNAAARVADKEEEPGNLFDDYGEEEAASYKDDPPGTSHEDDVRPEFADGYGTKTEHQLALEHQDPARPTWQESELKTSGDLDWADFTGQRSFGRGKEVRRGMAGSTRPDGYSQLFRLSIEVKNYGIKSARAETGLVQKIIGQMAERAPHLPKGSRQGVVIDVRGQRVPSSRLTALRARIVRDAGGLVAPDDIVFLTE
jgi:hypothetical protein